MSDKECYRRTEVKISLERRREARSGDEKRGSRSDMRKKDVSGRNDGHKDRELDEASMGTAACGRISENINLRLRNSVNDQKEPDSHDIIHADGTLEIMLINHLLYK